MRPLYHFTMSSMKELGVWEFHDHNWQVGEATTEAKGTSGMCVLVEKECFPDGWVKESEEGGQALCRRHDGRHMTLVDDWQGVVRCDHCERQSDSTWCC